MPTHSVIVKQHAVKMQLQVTSLLSEQLSAIRRYSFPRVLCDVVNDMLTIQPRPLRNVGPKNRRAACTTFPSFDLSPWQEHRASREDEYTEQGWYQQ